MINLDKERKAFESTRKDKLKNVKPEIDHDRGIIYVANTVWDQNEASDLDEQWWAWQQRAELAQQEISELKAKLAKYESDNVVIMPRIPSDEMIEAMGYAVCNMGGDCWLDTDEAYKAMIEAGEIK